MGYASAVLSSTEREFRQSNSNESTSSSGRKSGLLLNRNAKCLVLGGLAASCGYSLESSAGKAADVAGFGNLAMPDVSVGGTPRFQDYSPLIHDAEAGAFMSLCIQGIIAGGLGALIVRSPLPLVMGLSGCLSGASAQQPIGNEFQVNTYTTFDQDYPFVASLSSGNFVVIWQSYGQDGEEYGVYGQLFYGNGSELGNEFQANTYTTGIQRYASAAGFINGNFVVTWDSNNQDGGRYGVYGQLFDGNATRIGNEFQVNTYTNNTQAYSSTAGFINGNFVVTWESDGQDGSEDGIYGQLFDGNARRIGNEFQVNTHTDSWQKLPSAASFDNGNFVVIWQSYGQDGSNYGIYGQLFYNNGTELGNEFQVNTHTNSIQRYASAAGFINGNFVVTWESNDQDGDRYGVYGQLFDGNATRIGNEFQVNTYTNLEQAYPSVASFNNGNFVVAWESYGQDGSSDGIYGQLFNGNATRIRNEFQVNTHVINNQEYPSVASFVNGNFVVIWQSYLQDGSSDGIYGQLFEGPQISSSTASTASETITSSSTMSSSSSILNSTNNPPSSGTDLTTMTSSPTISSSTSNQPTSTHQTTSITSAELYTGEPSPSGGGSFLLPILLPIAGCICLLTGIGTYLLFKRRNQEEVLPSVELAEEEEDSNNDSQYANVSFIPNKENYANLPDDSSEYPKGYGNVPSDFVED